MYKNILFDLDGTLTDSGIGIKNAVIYALEKFDIIEPNVEVLNRFIGPPLAESFQSIYGLSEKECHDAILYYREYYSVKGLFENEVYEGIPEILAELKYKGHRVILATSKPKDFSVRILEHFNLLKYFDFIATATLDGIRSEKKDVISYALTETGIKEYKDTVMVGDRKQDILGAKCVGIDSIGVLYGYGNWEELSIAGATHIVETVSALKVLLRVK